MAAEQFGPLERRRSAMVDLLLLLGALLGIGVVAVVVGRGRWWGRVGVELVELPGEVFDDLVVVVV